MRLEALPCARILARELLRQCLPPTPLRLSSSSLRGHGVKVRRVLPEGGIGVKKKLFKRSKKTISGIKKKLFTDQKKTIPLYKPNTSKTQHTKEQQAERQKDRKKERKKERKRDRKKERKKDRKKERKKDRKKERKKERNKERNKESNSQNEFGVVQ